MNSVVKDDLEVISKKDYRCFYNKTFFITGATGLVGISLIRSLLYINDRQNLNLNIVAMARNEVKATTLLSDYINRKDFMIYVGDVLNPIDISVDVDYIIHCASVTTSKTMLDRPVETILTSLEGTKNVLELARVKNCESVVYVSSMEMYGVFSDGNQDVKETDLGYLNPLAIRSNYPESKRMCENMCVAYHSEYGIPIKIARLAQTFGAGILPGENRVFAQFAKSVIEQKDIVLHTQGKSEGNYVYTRDMVTGVLCILVKGENGEAYNVSNPDSHMSIANMAHMVSKDIANGTIKVVFDIPESNIYGYAADTKMKLNSNKLQQLGWIPEIGLKDAYKRLIISMMEQ